MSRSMVKFMIIFQRPTVQDTFENAYNDFLALVERMPDVTRRQVINIQGSPLGETRLHRILEVYFEDQAAMEAALRSEAGQEAGGELSRFTKGRFELVFAEVFEEEGGQTPPADDPAVENPSESAAVEDSAGDDGSAEDSTQETE